MKVHLYIDVLGAVQISVERGSLSMTSTGQANINSHKNSYTSWELVASTLTIFGKLPLKCAVSTTTLSMTPSVPSLTTTQSQWSPPLLRRVSHPSPISIPLPGSNKLLARPKCWSLYATANPPFATCARSTVVETSGNTGTTIPKSRNLAIPPSGYIDNLTCV